MALLSAGAITAVATATAVVYGILLRPLPYPQADRLAVIWQGRGAERTQLSYPDYQDLSALRVFESAAALSGGRGSLRVGNRIERVNVLSLEAAGFALLGARPMLGRLLTAADADQRTAMISHRLWTTHLDSDPDIIGRQIWLSGTEYTVVGVLPSGFDFELPVPPAFVLEENDVWTALERSSAFISRRDVSTYEALVRLAPDRTLQDAQAALDAVANRLARQHPSTNTGRGFEIALLEDEIVAPVRRMLTWVAVAAIITFGVALANLMVLNLVQRSERQTELAMREALGAGRWRLRRQLFTEHSIVVACGALIGAPLAYRSVGWMVASEAASLPRPGAIQFDWPVLAVTAVAAISLAGALTLQPIPSREGWFHGARLIGGGSTRSRRLLVATEITLAITLATGGSLLALSLAHLLATDIGFDPRGAAAARVSAYEAEYRSRDDVVRFFEDLVTELTASAGVTAAGAGSSLPLSGQFAGTSVVAEGRPVSPGQPLTAGWQFITPGYLEAVGMRLRAGRDFSAADRTRLGHVVLINEQLARTLFPGENPIGRRIGIGGGDAQGDWHEIVGVVADVKHQALDVPPASRVYDLFGQHWGRTLYVVARTDAGTASPLVNLVRAHVADFNADVPVFDGATLQQLVDRSAAARRLASLVASTLAVAGVLVAMIGVYAITAATVTERTREIGVRAALGAAPRDLLRLIASEGAHAVIWGSIAGTAGSVMAARLLALQLFEVSTSDTAHLIVAVVATVISAAILATVPPGRRVIRVDPAVSMRADG
jgi:putative ABC transport system permease protein